MSHPNPKRAKKAPGRPYPPRTVRERSLAANPDTFLPYPALQRAEAQPKPRRPRR